MAAQNDDTLTLVTYAGDVEIGGLIAGVGQRIIGGIAKMLAGQFFKNMENLRAPPPTQVDIVGFLAVIDGSSRTLGDDNGFTR